MRALHRKLLRDLWQIKGQGFAISLVIATGVAMFIAYLSTFQSLRLTQESYYDRCRFAEVFASLKRAPLRLRERIAAIPGVGRAETRVVVSVNLDLPGTEAPIVGRVISIPERRAAILNDLFLRRGRYIEPNRPDEVLVTEGFALARDLGPGDTVTAVVNGRRRELEIVGVALSPEYVYNIPPGEMMPDDGRFGLLWMGRKALATAFDMEGGFNDVALTLMPGASEPEVIARLDRLLEPYGGLGGIPRALQLSHWYLEAELTGLQGAAFIIPVIFLGVAAFLLNVVLLRIVAVQREQIAALKALGYTNLEIGWHYTGWSLAIALVGGVLGTAGGAWLGSAMTALYNDYYRFPVLTYRLAPGMVVAAALVCVAAAVLGAFAAVKRAVRLPPAEAMRPEPPASYRESWIERIGLKRLFSQPARMILRNLQRRPWRTAVAVVGIAFAVALPIVGTFLFDAIDVLLEVQFDLAQRHDLTVSFFEPASARAIHELGRLPGVVYSEPLRSAPARLRLGHRSRQTAITGLPAGARLHRIVDASYAPVALPPEGLVLSSKLAEILGAGRGDTLTVEVLEGTRPIRRVVVADLVDEYMGTAAYMEIGALRRMLREGRNLSGASLQVDAAQVDELYRRLKLIPAVAGVALKSAAIDSFNKTIAETLGILIFFNVLFSGIIAFGVVYNAARVSLSERSRELASLRVMGFTRAEISFILLGELATVTLLALPLGMILGYGLAALTATAYDTELYRFPLVVSSRTYAFAALTVVAAAVISGLVVRRKLDRLDLIAVLKTRE
ncbi:MAG: FtsX-like permease family protein [bacterium]|nr:FtsX-like permease family protein [bacterium]